MGEDLHNDIDFQTTIRIEQSLLQSNFTQKSFENAIKNAKSHIEKGDVLSVARVAGVMAAKNTSQLIPLCHPLPIDQIILDYIYS